MTAPAFPETLEECAVPAELTAGEAPSCVPSYARGRELARDDAARMRAYEACLPESRSSAGSSVRVDPRRVVIERAGERRANEDELQVIVGRLGMDISTREPELATSPWVVACRDDRFSDGARCLALNLLARRPDLPAVMAALAKWLPIEPICVPMKVEFGAPEGCPIGEPQHPLAQ